MLNHAILKELRRGTVSRQVKSIPKVMPPKHKEMSNKILEELKWKLNHINDKNRPDIGKMI